MHVQTEAALAVARAEAAANKAATLERSLVPLQGRVRTLEAERAAAAADLAAGA